MVRQHTSILWAKRCFFARIAASFKSGIISGVVLELAV
jgi:hypothetical protein